MTKKCKCTIVTILRIMVLVIIILNTLFSRKMYADGNFIHKEKRNVLLLNSYHKGYLWTDEITRGVEESLLGHVNDLNVEYMDTKRQFDDAYLELMSELLHLKHEKHNYEVIITSDNNAFNYLKKNRNKVFGNIPIVFCGVNYLQKEELEGINNITGLSEEADLIGNLELIEKVHPDCERIILVSDNTTTGKRIQDEYWRIKEKGKTIKPELSLIYDVSAQELIDTLNNLNKTDIVLYTIFFQDKHGTFIEFDKAARMVCNNSPVPVYGLWNFSFGYGIVGGYLTTGYEQGFIAGKKAHEILLGKPADEIPVQYKPATKLKFDYRQIERFNISTKNLPINSEISFQPISFIKKYKKLIRNLAVLIGLLIVFIFILTYLLTRSQLIKRELQKNQKHIKSLVSNIPGVVYRCVADEKKSIVFLSDTIYNISGYPAKDFIDTKVKTLNDIIHDEDQELVNTRIKDALDKGKSWEIVYRIINNEGENRWVFEKGQGILNDENEYEYLDGLFLDVTAQKKIEMNMVATNEKLTAATEALEKSNKDLIIALEEAKRSKELEIANRKLKEAQSQLVESEKMASVGILTAGIAHEINNPLNFIHGGKVSLEKYVNQNLNEHSHEIQPLLDIIDTGIKRTTDIISSLNRFNRRSNVYNEKCNIHSIIEDCLVMIANQTKHKVNIIKNYIDPNLEVIGNEGRLHQVILNILINSVQAIEDTGVISISSSVQKNNVALEIADTGCGICEINLSKITEPFFTTKDPGKGTGLGLSIANQIVSDHNGTLKFKSELGKGTSTTLKLPIYNGQHE